MRRPLRPPGSSPARTIPRSARIETIPETVEGASDVRRASSAWVRGPAIRRAVTMRCSLAARNEDCEPGPGSSRANSIGEAMEQSHHKKRQDVNDPGSSIALGHMILVGSDPVSQEVGNAGCVVRVATRSVKDKVVLPREPAW